MCSQTFIHSYASGGSYTAIVAVKDSNGGTTIAALKVEVTTAPAPLASGTVPPAAGPTATGDQPTSQAGPSQPDQGTGSGAQPPAAGGSGESGAQVPANSQGGGNAALIRWLSILLVVAVGGAGLVGLGLLARLGFAALAAARSS